MWHGQSAKNALQRSRYEHVQRCWPCGLVDEVLLITTKSAATPEFRIYNVRRLLKADQNSEHLARTTATALGIPFGQTSAEDIADRNVGFRTADPKSSAVGYHDHLIVVRGTNNLQFEIQQLLRGMDAGARDRPHTSRVLDQQRGQRRREAVLRSRVRELALTVNRLKKRLGEEAADPPSPLGDDGDDPFGSDDVDDPFGCQ